MKGNKHMLKNKTNLEYSVDEHGSLGLLAYGHLGLKAWRQAKIKAAKNKNTTNEKK